MLTVLTVFSALVLLRTLGIEIPFGSLLAVRPHRPRQFRQATRTERYKTSKYWGDEVQVCSEMARLASHGLVDVRKCPAEFFLA
jgi:hypothetical protein